MEEFIEKLKRRAEVFLINAVSNREMEAFDIAMFNLDQAAQLLLKARILEFGVQFPKIHDISKLIDILCELGVDIGKLKEDYRETIEKLNQAYISSRYLLSSFYERDVEEALKFVKELRRRLWIQ